MFYSMKKLFNKKKHFQILPFEALSKIKGYEMSSTL